MDSVIFAFETKHLTLNAVSNVLNIFFMCELTFDEEMQVKHVLTSYLNFLEKEIQYSRSNDLFYSNYYHLHSLTSSAFKKIIGSSYSSLNQL